LWCVLHVYCSWMYWVSACGGMYYMYICSWIYWVSACGVYYMYICSWIYWVSACGGMYYMYIVHESIGWVLVVAGVGVPVWRAATATVPRLPAPAARGDQRAHPHAAGREEPAQLLPCVQVIITAYLHFTPFIVLFSFRGVVYLFYNKFINPLLLSGSANNRRCTAQYYPWKSIVLANFDTCLLQTWFSLFSNIRWLKHPMLVWKILKLSFNIILIILLPIYCYLMTC